MYWFLYMTSIPWQDLKGEQLTDSGERPYILAKVYLMMFSKELSKKLAGSNVDVNMGKHVRNSAESLQAAMQM